MNFIESLHDNVHKLAELTGRDCGYCKAVEESVHDCDMDLPEGACSFCLAEWESTHPSPVE